ncbi:unnamed protein product, partial [Phaeothamnion confervicola]
GDNACSLLLKQAASLLETASWKLCREVAAEAREMAWEELHGGPSWREVAPVHRQAYGLAGIMGALAGVQAGSLPAANAMYELDMVTVMAGDKCRDMANSLIDAIRAKENGVSATTTTKDGSGSVHLSRSPPSPSSRARKRPRSSWKSERPDKDAAVSDEDLPRVHCPSLTAFLRDYMQQARPVIITGAMNNWPALGLSHGSGNG